MTRFELELNIAAVDIAMVAGKACNSLHEAVHALPTDDPAYLLWVGLNKTFLAHARAAGADVKGLTYANAFYVLTARRAALREQLKNLERDEAVRAILPTSVGGLGV